ncbi:hypothetical protein G6F70_001927 [Rhizopus microsporus]|uniref:Uncharacterized protein n=1 Tax=Rhizopus azygosporus TaxID=86630 RepID=A0A367J0R9_RHIAZ|nr:hypothetical protein G6F71_003787 [Rhizopus microsporus]RCH83311.1 hypothetical protein CU097_002848 [Rhizopus azygosporus]KAG1202840.1 hypothetical protein G6F70_001927 [Rhizopus microsporus]KAG1212488.1 hypothetical protein G6F69_003672 [Rhizopus microsporus]KAG1234523.1 hypothetical protein G6F67_003472 [Rhizopus microsporus]
MAKRNEKDIDNDLAERFNKVFATQAIAARNDYQIPSNLDEKDITQEIEKMLYETDDEEDAIDDYIYGVLTQSEPQQGRIQQKMKQIEDILLGPDNPIESDESDALIKKAIEENRLDEKYQQFTAKRDTELQERLKNIQNYVPSSSSTSCSAVIGDKPVGSVPKAISTKDLYDETDDWCCVCNEDAIIECEGCEDDNKYCTECFFQTHRSEFADYEATKHKSKKYQKRVRRGN